MSEKRARITAVIPARMASTRFPGKPLAPIAGMPMVEMVRRRVALSELVDEVFVATCDTEIAETVERHGGHAMMTADTHERCTDRVHEAAGSLDADIVVIVQGDEPLFDPDVIRMLVEPMLARPDVACTNLLSVIADEADLSDHDIVKAVCDLAGHVMYLSRAHVPFMREAGHDVPMLRQTGLSAFTATFLDVFASLAPTPLEIAESIDFLRILEHGHVLEGVVWDRPTHGVDRPEDVAAVEAALADDPFQTALHARIAGPAPAGP